MSYNFCQIGKNLLLPVLLLVCCILFAWVLFRLNQITDQPFVVRIVYFINLELIKFSWIAYTGPQPDECLMFCAISICHYTMTKF